MTALRILYLGNDYWREKASRSTGFYTRFFHGLVRNGHFVHYADGPNEARQLAPLGIRRLGAAAAAERLVDIAMNFRPDVVVVAYLGPYFEAIAEIRRRFSAVRVAYLNVDALFSEPNRRNVERMREVADAIFVTTGGELLGKLSCTRSHLHFYPNVVDSSIDTGRAFANPRPAYDLCCFLHGNHNSSVDQAHRIGLADAAAASLAPERVFFGGFNGHPAVYGQDYLEVIGGSAMVLNLNRHIMNGRESLPDERVMYASDRIAHIVGNGALALTEEGFALDRLFARDEMVFFDGLEDLVAKVKFYAVNAEERMRIARKGWQKAHRAFNERIVMAYVIDRVMERPLSHAYEWPTD